MLRLHFKNLGSVELVCAHLQTNPSALRSFLDQPERHYTPKVIVKRRGRLPRVVYEVSPPLRRIHRIIHVALTPHVVRMPACVQGFRKGRNIGTNAKAHIGAELLVTADIHAFFDNIRIADVTAVFQRLGAPHHAALLLARLTTLDGILPQGGRASPALANLVARDLDADFLRLGDGVRYTRYADDLAFSGPTSECPTQQQIVIVLERHGFSLRPGSFTKQPRRSGQVVTGVSLFHAKPTLSRSRRRKIERALYYGSKFGLASHVKRAGLVGIAMKRTGCVGTLILQAQSIDGYAVVGFTSCKASSRDAPRRGISLREV